MTTDHETIEEWVKGTAGEDAEHARLLCINFFGGIG